MVINDKPSAVRINNGVISEQEK